VVYGEKCGTVRHGRVGKCGLLVPWMVPDFEEGNALDMTHNITAALGTRLSDR